MLTLLSGGAFAVELTWKPETGGALDDAGNWEVTKDENDRHWIDKSLSGSLFLNGDWTVGGEFNFKGCTNTLDLGVGRTLSSSVFNTHGRTDVSLTSGTFTASGHNRIGNSSDNNRFVIDGPNTKYVSTYSTQMTLGHNSKNNRVEVQNGATFDAPVRIGYSGACQNTLSVSGAGTVWTNGKNLTAFVCIGHSEKSCGNSVIVADGAEVTAGSGRVLIGNNATSWDNSFLLAGGAKLTSVGEVRLAAESGSWGNTLVVANGSTLPLDVKLPYSANSVSNTLVLCGAGTTWDRGSSELYIGEKSGADYTSFVLSNGVEFTTSARLRMASQALEDGTVRTALSEHNRILVASGAKLSAQTLWFEGNNNSVEVTGKGSTLKTTSGSLYIPKDVGSKTDVMTNNVLRIADGGRLEIMAPADAKTLYVYGRNGLDIDGGTVDVYGEMDFGYYGGGRSFSRVRNGGTLIKHGEKQTYVGVGGDALHNVLEVSNGGKVMLTDGANYFRINNNGGYGNALIIDNGTFDAPAAVGYVSNSKYDNDVPADDGDRIVVRNNGVLNCKRLVVGRDSPFARFEVENGEVNISTTLEVSYEYEGSHPAASNAVMRLAGTNANVVVGTTMTLSKTATLIVDVTGPQAAEAMMTAAEFSFKTGSKIRITSSTPFADDDPTFRATVLKCTGGDIDFSKVTIEVDPNCGLKRRSSAANALVVGHRKKEGLAVIVR